MIWNRQKLNLCQKYRFFFVFCTYFVINSMLTLHRCIKLGSRNESSIFNPNILINVFAICSDMIKVSTVIWSGCLQWYDQGVYSDMIKVSAVIWSRCLQWYDQGACSDMIKLLAVICSRGLQWYDQGFCSDMMKLFVACSYMLKVSAVIWWCL